MAVKFANFAKILSAKIKMGIGLALIVTYIYSTPRLTFSAFFIHRPKQGPW
jgi:hypothetical protein